MRRCLHEMRQRDADDVQHILQLEGGALTILNCRCRSSLRLGTNQIAANYTLIVSQLSGRFVRRPDKKRELRTALAVALGLALVCFGGAVVASTFLISH